MAESVRGVLSADRHRLGEQQAGRCESLAVWDREGRVDAACGEAEEWALLAVGDVCDDVGGRQQPPVCQ